MDYIITAEQLQALLNYLVTKPYHEVHQGITLLKSLKAIPLSKEQELKKKDDFKK